MKKSLAVLFGFMSINTFAAGNLSAEQKVDPNQIQPKLKLAVYDLSGKVPKDIGQKYSLSKQNQALCWTAFDMPFSPTNQNHITQIITAPNGKAKFVAEGSGITVSPDKRTTTITSVLPSYNNQFIEYCWAFDKTDPRGKYSITVQVNDVKFGTLTYEVTK